MRIWCNGSIIVFQTVGIGSTPLIRSKRIIMARVLEINGDAKASTQYFRAARTRKLKAELAYINNNKNNRLLKSMMGEAVFHKKLEYHFPWDNERKEWTL
jgi:hypothetical protein